MILCKVTPISDSNTDVRPLNLSPMTTILGAVISSVETSSFHNLLAASSRGRTFLLNWTARSVDPSSASELMYDIEVVPVSMISRDSPN